MRHLIYKESIQALRARQKARRKGKPENTPTSRFIYRTGFALVSAVIGLILGGLFDLATTLIRTLSQPNSDPQVAWFLIYVFAVMGALVGFFTGSRAGELFVQFFASEDHGVSNSSSELIRLIAKTLLVAALIWCLLLIFM